MKRNSVSVIGAHTCFSALSLFINIFLVAQIYNLSGESITAVGLFVLLTAVMIFTFYAVSSAFCKMVHGIWIVRVAAVLICIFVITVIVTEDNLGSLYVLYGAIWGAVQGLYWGALNFLLSAISKKNSISFFVWFNAFAASVSVIFPFTFGAAIDYLSFIFTSGIVLGIAIVMLLFLLLPRFEAIKKDKLRMLAYFRELKASGNTKRVMHYGFIGFLYGFNFTFSSLMTILIIMVYGSSMSIGIFGSLFGLLGILLLFGYKRIGKKARPPFLVASGLLPFLATIPLFFSVSPATIMIFNATIVLQHILFSEENETRINLPKYLGHEQFQIESNLFFDFSFVCGRIVSCGMLIIVGLIGFSQTLFATAICITMACFFAHTLLLFLYKRKLTALR